MSVLELLKGWERLKTMISTELQLDRSVLHVHVGLACYVTAATLLRRPFGSWLPLAAVAVVELANELLDFARYQLSDWPWTPAGTVRDAIDTLFWPAILTVANRIRQRLFRFEPGLP